MHLRVVLAVVVAVATISACGSDDDATGPAEVPSSVTAGATPDDRDEQDDQDNAISGEEICERLTVASISADTGLDVVRATPDDDAAPQCAYEYTTEAGGVSNLTVASMRSEDMGGLAGSAAFDFVVRSNEAVVGAAAETQEVSAGDNAIRMSGPSLHVGVVQLGDRVLTLIIPVNDVNADGVDSLIATMATTLD